MTDESEKKSFIVKVKNLFREKLLIIIQGISPKALSYAILIWFGASIVFSIWVRGNGMCKRPPINLERVMMLRLLCPQK